MPTSTSFYNLTPKSFIAWSTQVRWRSASGGLEMSVVSDDSRWNTQATFYVVHFPQGKPSRWQGPWTFLDLYWISGSLLPPSCITYRSAHRWATWAACTTPFALRWELVGCFQGEPALESSENSRHWLLEDRLRKHKGSVFLLLLKIRWL